MVTRVGGLSSGMDIDSIVEKLMSTEKQPLNKLYQQKQIYEWQRDSYRDINTKLKTFNDYLFDNFSLTSKFVYKNTSVSGINSSNLTVKAGANAAGSLEVQSIKQLAKNAKTEVATLDQTTHRFANDTDLLSDLNVTSGSFNLKIESKNTDGDKITEFKSISFSAGDSIKSFVDKLKAAGLTESKYDVDTGKFTIAGPDKTVSVTDFASIEKLKSFGFSSSNSFESIKVLNEKSEQINAPKTTLLSKLGINAGTFKLKVGDTEKSFTIENTDTIESFVNKLNAENSGIKVSYSETSGTFSLSSTKLGEKVTAAYNETFETLKKLGNRSTVSTSSSHFIQLNSGEEKTPTAENVLGHLGLLEDGSLTLNVVQADGEMKKTTINYSKDDTIDTFIKRLNGSGAGVTALFSKGKLSITANNTGRAKDPSVTSEIQITSTDSEGNPIPNDKGKQLLGKLGLITEAQENTTEDLDLVSGTNRGQNAIYAVNGLVMESNSNSVNISGYEIVLNGTFNESNIDANNEVTGTITNEVRVSSSNDIDAIVDKVKEFVTKYNELVENINNQLTQTKYRDYAPLTTEQREEMSENEQKLWDEKAKSGLLRNDSILRAGLSEMRNAIYGQVEGLGDKIIDTFHEIGITTIGSYNDGGKLALDETKLREALSNDPERVIKTFNQSGDKNGPEGDTRGIITRLRDSINSFTIKIENKAGRTTMTDNQYALGKTLVDMEKRIENWKDKLETIEERYWSQFNAMEQAINKANSQATLFQPSV